MLAEGISSLCNTPPASEEFSLRSNVQRIVIFANGELPDLDKARSLLQSDDYIICADGGTRHAMALGVRPDIVIGDLDSAEQAALQKYSNEESPSNHILPTKMRPISNWPLTVP